MNYTTSNSIYGNWFNDRPNISTPQPRFHRNICMKLPILRQISNIKISKENTNCSICLNNQKDKVIRQLNCGHKFHIECIDIWFEKNNNCPLCRKTF